MLFTGLIPLFVLIGVSDPSWSAGFLLVYLGLLLREPALGDREDAESKDEQITQPVGRMWYLAYSVCLGFLWILLFAALLWYVPEPATDV